MATKVIDSWALMALFNEEPAAEAVEKLLHAATAGRHTLLMSVVNWGEIYYTALRRGGERGAKAIVADIAQRTAGFHSRACGDFQGAPRCRGRYAQ